MVAQHMQQGELPNHFNTWLDVKNSLLSGACLLGLLMFPTENWLTIYEWLSSVVEGVECLFFDVHVGSLSE